MRQCVTEMQDRFLVPAYCNRTLQVRRSRFSYRCRTEQNSTVLLSLSRGSSALTLLRIVQLMSAHCGQRRVCTALSASVPADRCTRTVNIANRTHLLLSMENNERLAVRSLPALARLFSYCKASAFCYWPRCCIVDVLLVLSTKSRNLHR